MNKNDKISVLFDAQNGQILLDKLKTQQRQPNIVLLDFSMPILDGRETTILIKKYYPSIKVLILSMFHHEYLISSIINAGANGFLSKNIEPAILDKAIHVVNENNYFIETCPGNFEEYKFSSERILHKYFPNHLKVTYKQKLFIQLCATGLTYNEIAQKMGISSKTVNNYRELLCERFNVANRIELVLFAILNGIVDILN